MPAASGLQLDLAPSDFLFFKYLKGKLSDYNCQSREDLLNVITEILTGIDREMLLIVFESWVNRLKLVMKHERKHYTEKRKNTR
jgi:hypothetical protein